MVNPSIHLQLQHTGDEHGCPPGQYRAARSGNPNLGFVEPAPSATRAGYGPIPGSEILPYIYDSSKPGTTTVVLRVNTAPHGVETPTPLADCGLPGVREATGTRRAYDPILGTKRLPYIYHSN